jgi:hypothetical protein
MQRRRVGISAGIANNGPPHDDPRVHTVANGCDVDFVFDDHRSADNDLTS